VAGDSAKQRLSEPSWSDGTRLWWPTQVPLPGDQGHKPAGRSV